MLRPQATLVLALSLAAVGSGCSALINPDDGRLGGDGVGDAATADTGVARADAGPAVEDAGARPDASAPDAFVPCVSPPRCDGGEAVRCVDGVEVRERCADDQVCEVGRCQAPGPECTFGERRCLGDVRQTCFGGAWQDREACEHGCDAEAGACLPPPPPECPGVPDIARGETVEVDLCQGEDDFRHGPGNDCGADTESDGRDAIFQFDVVQGGIYTFELTDVDRNREVDTVVYLRRDCSDPSSQVACGDDVRCFSSTVPGDQDCGGWEVRQSRVQLPLGPGRYYVIADSYDYASNSTRYGCGVVQLRVE